MFTRAACTLALLTALPAFAAQPGEDAPVAERFAICQGRFAAMRGTDWPVAGMLSAETASLRFDDLFAAIGPPPQDRGPAAVRLRQQRAEAQNEQARLLSIALYSPDIRRARRASATIAERLRVCAAMVMP